jgi:glycosyltransferase involved in cell wall biosynthesis
MNQNKEIYFDLTWMKSLYGGYNHYAKQIIDTYSNNPHIKYLINSDYSHLFDKQTINRSILLEVDSKSRWTIIRRIYYYYFRLIKLGKIQKKMDAPFVYPADPGHLIRYNQIVYIKHDVCRVTSPDLFGSGFNSTIFWGLYGSLYTKKADIVGTVSNYSKSQIKKHLKIQDDRIFVTFNYVNSVEQGDWPYDRKSLLFIGALVKRKNVKILLELNDYITKNKLFYNIVIIGRQTKYWRKIAQNFDTSRILFKTNISDEEKYEYFKSSFLLYLTKCEGFGIPTIEAVNHGCPVICYDIPIMREILGKTGIYISQDEINVATKVIDAANKYSQSDYNSLIMERRSILSVYSQDKFKIQFDSMIEQINEI